MATIIDSRVNYRFGSPILPVLPVVTRPLCNATKKCPDWDAHLPRIQEILNRNNIKWSHIQSAYLLHADSELHDKYITITTVAAFNQESTTTWPRAVEKIREYLNQVKIYHAIEIIASALCQDLKTFPFATDIYQWNTELLPTIRTLINDRQWTTLDMVYREDIETPGKSRPTIVIGARDADEQYWWDDTLPLVRAQVAQFDIQVELHYRRHIFAADPNAILLERCLDSSDIRLGASCGNGNHVGTLGGGIRLKSQDAGAEQAFGITNHHVLANKLTGDGPFTSFKDAIKVESPSSFDRDFLKKNLETRIKDLEDTANDPQVVGVIQALRAELARIQSFDLYVGQVFASSGYRLAKKRIGEKGRMDSTWALDWCLTTLEKRPTSDIFRHDTVGTKKVIGYCSLDPFQGYRVFKQGRTSGATTGYVSATHSAIRTRTLAPENGLTALPTDVDFFQAEVRCHAMIADRRTHPDAEFIRRGDSGSLILLDPANCTIQEDEEGKGGFKGLSEESPTSSWEPLWKSIDTNATTPNDSTGQALVAGLAFGGSEAYLVSYMMPIDIVVQDIEFVTGLKVVEPKFAGVVKRNETKPTT